MDGRKPGQPQRASVATLSFARVHMFTSIQPKKSPRLADSWGLPRTVSQDTSKSGNLSLAVSLLIGIWFNPKQPEEIPPLMKALGRQERFSVERVSGPQAVHARGLRRQSGRRGATRQGVVLGYVGDGVRACASSHINAGATTAPGKWRRRSNAKQGLFKTPTFATSSSRDRISITAPPSTLKQVVDFYNWRGNFPDDLTDSHIQPLGPTEAQKDSLVAFLLSLSDNRGRTSAPFDQPSLCVQTVKRSTWWPSRDRPNDLSTRRRRRMRRGTADDVPRVQSVAAVDPACRISIHQPKTTSYFVQPHG